MWMLSGVQIHMAVEPVDGRKGIPGLMGLVNSVLRADPYGGHAFVFVGRRQDLVKVLLFSRGGFVLLLKRLERGRFPVPKVSAEATHIPLSSVQLSMLLDGMALAPQPTHWEPKRIDKVPKV